MIKMPLWSILVVTILASIIFYGTQEYGLNYLILFNLLVALPITLIYISEHLVGREACILCN